MALTIIIAINSRLAALRPSAPPRDNPLKPLKPLKP